MAMSDNPIFKTHMGITREEQEQHLNSVRSGRYGSPTTYPKENIATQLREIKETVQRIEKLLTPSNIIKPTAKEIQRVDETRSVHRTYFDSYSPPKNQGIIFESYNLTLDDEYLSYREMRVPLTVKPDPLAGFKPTTIGVRNVP